MSTIPKGQQIEFEHPEDGTYLAVCVGAIQLGTQQVKDFKTGNLKDQSQFRLVWQLVTEQTTEGRAMVVMKKYTYSDSDNSNLVKDLRSWGLLKKDQAASEFDMAEVLGKPCQVSVSTKEGSSFTNVDTVIPVMKGVKVPRATEPMRALFLDETFDQAVFDELSEKTRNKIAGSPEYAALIAERESNKRDKAAKKSTPAPAKKAAPTKRK